jgi:hypothetical protein
MKRNRSREALIESMRRLGGDEAVEKFFSPAELKGIKLPLTGDRLREHEQAIKAEADAFWAGVYTGQQTDTVDLNRFDRPKGQA